jgi:hypothetical protein
MYILELVIIFLFILLLYSTGWLVRIFQILISRLMDFGKAFLESFIKDQIEEPEAKKKSKRSK